MVFNFFDMQYLCILSGNIGTKGWGDDGLIKTLGVDFIYTNSNLEGRVNA